MFENHDFLSAKEETETPVIFLRTFSDRIKNAKSLKEILGSYEQFKAVSNEKAETSAEKNFDYGSSSLTKPIIEDGIAYAAEEALETLEDVEPVIPSQAPPATKSMAKEHRIKSKLHKSPEHERKARQKSLLNNLICYLEVCVETGMPNRGLGTILHYRQKSKKYQSNPKITTIEPFNILLHGFAAEGNYDKIFEIVKVLEERKTSKI